MDQKTLYLDLNHAFNQVFRQLFTRSGTGYRMGRNGQLLHSGRLAQHLLSSAAELLQLVNGPVRPGMPRTGMKIPAIGQLLGGEENNPDSCLGNEPDLPAYDALWQQEQLNELQQRWLEATRTLDPGATCLLYPLPGIGLVTRQEAAYFLFRHFRLHLR